MSLAVASWLFELHPENFEDFLPGMALGAQVYDPRDKASMIWRNLQLIACIGDHGLEEIEVVNFDCEIRKQAQFPPRRQRQRVSISLGWPPRGQPSHDSANAFAIQRNAISNDMIVPICCLPLTSVVGRHLPSGSTLEAGP